MNVACCLLVAAVGVTAWCRNEYIFVAHLHLLAGLSNSIIINAHPRSFASPLTSTANPIEVMDAVSPADETGHTGPTCALKRRVDSDAPEE